MIASLVFCVRMAAAHAQDANKSVPGSMPPTTDVVADFLTRACNKFGNSGPARAAAAPAPARVPIVIPEGGATIDTLRYFVDEKVRFIHGKLQAGRVPTGASPPSHRIHPYSHAHTSLACKTLSSQPPSTCSGASLICGGREAGVKFAF